MIKKPHPNTKRKTEANKVRTWWEYRHQGTWKMRPYTQESLIRLAQDLKEWADKETSLRINDFYNFHGIHAKVFYEMLAKCIELEEAHDYAMERIASRREIGSMTRKYDTTTIFKTQAYYDSIYRQEQERSARLKLEAEAAQNQQKVKVELEIVEKTGHVKPLENK